MIIARVGSTRLKLESRKDADALLSIAFRATLVGETSDSEWKEYQYLHEGDKRITIELTESDTMVSFKEL